MTKRGEGGTRREDPCPKREKKTRAELKGGTFGGK